MAGMFTDDRLQSFKHSNDERRREILAVLTVLKDRRPDAVTEPRVTMLEGLAAGLELLQTIVSNANESSRAA